MTLQKKEVIDVLNEMLEREYSGVIRYSHYSLMVFGYNRIPIVKWFREQATESLGHAEQIGEHVTTLGGHPSLKVSKLLEGHKHSIGEILREALDHEREQLKSLHLLLKLTEDQIIHLEEFARSMITAEEAHVAEIEKMLRTPPS